MGAPHVPDRVGVARAGGAGGGHPGHLRGRVRCGRVRGVRLRVDGDGPVPAFLRHQPGGAGGRGRRRGLKSFTALRGGWSCHTGGALAAFNNWEK